MLTLFSTIFIAIIPLAVYALSLSIKTHKCVQSSFANELSLTKNKFTVVSKEFIKHYNAWIRNELL
jgi:hypothetical protein